MTNSNADNKNKKKSLNPIFFGILAFVLILGAMIFNAVREAVSPMLFPPAYKIAFDKGVALAKTDQAAGIQMMEAALAECEKSKDNGDAKASLFYRYGVWNFNEVGLPNRFAIAKKAYTTAQELTSNMTTKAMSFTMMANCDYYSGVVGDAEKNADAALKCRHSGGSDDPGSMWCTLEAAGRAYMNAGHYDKAIKAFSEGLEQARKENLFKGTAATESTRFLACAYALAGKRDLADATFLETIKTDDQLLGVGNSDSDLAIVDYARTLKKTGDLETAQKLISRLDSPRKMDDYEPGWQAM
ncbi:MAG TPA: tetratricopeptide repeat protein [Oculatellaceae cyanobacterium]